MDAIKATLEDYKRIKTRGAWQIVLEIPEAELPNAMKVLGNPVSGESIWVAVARLNLNQEEANAYVTDENLRSAGRQASADIRATNENGEEGV